MSSRIRLGEAWTNPAKSVHVAKLPPKNVQEKIDPAFLNVSAGVPRVLRKPVAQIFAETEKPEIEAQKDAEWQTVGSAKKAADSQQEQTVKSAEEIEKQKQARKERRQREKAAKKLKKEAEKRTNLLGPKDSKIQLISSNFIEAQKTTTSTKDSISVSKSDPPTFEEYPSLSEAKPSGRIKAKREIVEETPGEKESEDGPLILTEEKDEPIQDGDKKKIKRKDPIFIDLSAALKPAKPTVKVDKVAKPAKLPEKKAVRNVLDSSAPTQRRGKEREVPKKKRPSKLKKVILIEKKARREQLVLNNQAAHEDESPCDALHRGVGFGQASENADLPDACDVLTSTSQVDHAERESETADNSPGIEHPKEIFSDISQENTAPIDVNNETPLSELRVGHPNEFDQDVCDDFSSDVQSNLCDKLQSIRVTEDCRNEDSAERDKAGDAFSHQTCLADVNQLTVEEKAKILIHSRKFRDYCDHVLSAEIDSAVRLMLEDLVKYQDRQFAKDPVKAKARRRYVVGLREIRKFLQVKKINLLILAPDVERIESKDGLNDVINELIRLARENEVPYVFSMNRYKLAKSCLRKVPISGLGVLNYQGSDGNFAAIMSSLPVQRETYRQKYEQALSVVSSPTV